MDERKEKFVVYGAVGMDDAGSFFYDASCDRNRDSSRRAKLSINIRIFFLGKKILLRFNQSFRSSILLARSRDRGIVLSILPEDIMLVETTRRNKMIDLR